jgi:putative membrane protein
LADATTMLNNLGEGVSGCERIITTPIPVSYRIYLKRLILIFCLSLPCRLVPALGWWSLPIVMVVSFVLMGVEEVGRELENPFGYGLNDLPLNDICDGIVAAVESTIALGTAPESVSESVPDSV